MFELLRSLLRHRRLLKDFVVRDLKARYVGSTMGFFWSVVFPIINLFVYMFVFRLVLNARWSDSQGALEVAIVMLAGIVVWTAFAETISRATNTLVDNANLIQKVVFPAEILPSYLTLSSLINMCIGLPVVLGAVFWFGHVSPPKAYLHVPHQWVPVEGQEKPERRPVTDRIGEWDRRRGADDKRAHEYAVRVFLTRAWREDVRIPFRVSGTATRGSDYLLPGDEIVIPSGELMGLLVIVPLSDDDPTEGDETVVIELDPASDVPLLGTKLVETESGAVVQRGDGVDEGGPRIEFVIADAGPAEADALRGGNAGVFIPGKQRDPKDIQEVHYPLSLGPGLLMLPVLFLLQVVFTVGLGYFLAAFNLFLRDTFHLVGVGITVWMFSTPIFYPGAMVQQAGFGWILLVNPMHWLIHSYRSVLLYGVWPDPAHLVMLLGASIFTLFLGSRFFMAQRSKFPDLL